MGKYDDLIGGFQFTISVDDVLCEQENANDVRRNLVEQLIELTEEDIEDRESGAFCDKDWALEEKEYLRKFRSCLQEYLDRL